MLADKAIKSFKVNEKKLVESLSKPHLGNSSESFIGYEKAAEIAKKAYLEKRPIIDVAAEMTDLSIEKLQELLNPSKLTEGGLKLINFTRSFFINIKKINNDLKE